MQKKNHWRLWLTWKWNWCDLYKETEKSLNCVTRFTQRNCASDRFFPENIFLDLCSYNRKSEIKEYWITWICNKYDDCKRNFKFCKHVQSYVKTIRKISEIIPKYFRKVWFLIHAQICCTRSLENGCSSFVVSCSN